MAKRLKKRIQEVCGLVNLSREDKARRARHILGDAEEKQRICNELLGAKFKDIEKTLQDIVDSKKFSTKEQREEQELLEDAPEKIHGPIKPTMATTTAMEYLLDENEVRALIKASHSPYVDPPSIKIDTSYKTFTADEAIGLINGNYNPTRFKRKGR